MKKSVKRFLIALAVLIIAGLVLLVGGIALGGSFHQMGRLTSWGPLGIHFYPFWAPDYSYHGVEEDYHWKGWSDESISCHAQNQAGVNLVPAGIENVSSLEIDLRGMEDVSITMGDDYALYIDHQDCLRSYVKNGTWHIETHRRHPMGSIQIVLPRDAVYTQIDLELSAGLLVAEKLNTMMLEVDMTAGSMELNDVNCSDAELNMTAGELTVNGTVTRLAEIEVTAGTVNWNMPRPAGYRYNLTGGVGSVTIDGQAFEGVTVGNGSNGTGGPTFQVECVAGTVDIAFEDAA